MKRKSKSLIGSTVARNDLLKDIRQVAITESRNTRDIGGIRKGIRIRCGNAHPDVCSAMKRFAKWLRKNYEFPIRVPVYLFSQEQIRNMSGHLVSATFYGPYELSNEPYIRIATGDYTKLKQKFGKDAALACTMCSLAHEVVHYIQWYKGKNLTDKGVAKKARTMVDCYSFTVDRYD